MSACICDERQETGYRLSAKFWIMLKLTFAALGAVAAVAPAFADDAPFVTGRPGNTESPIAVPTGHWQIETAIADYSHDREAGVTEEGWSALQTSFRYGLAYGWDAEAIVSPYQRDAAGGASVGGFGDVTLRVRHTFSGEDGNGPSFALIGYATLPTSKNGLGVDRVEGGLIATGVEPLNAKTSLTLTLGAGAVHDGGYEGDVYGGANVSYAFTDKIGGYIELFADRTAHDDTAATFDFGATYLTGPTTQLDCGVNLGLTDAASDEEVFVGWSHRF
ncbi:MAG: transporter [Alphaproteobacteria bacterium]